MARPKGSGGRSSYDKYRKYMSTRKRLTGTKNRATRRKRASSWDTGMRNKYTKKSWWMK